MKIEKISDTQIRCTLSRQDLADRDLKISELAYGSDKAKDLFRELMVQASYECGFEAEDIPTIAKKYRGMSGQDIVDTIIKSKVKTYVKKVETAITAGDKAAAQVALVAAISEIDKATTKGVFHKNTASRKVSRLSKAVNAMA